DGYESATAENFGHDLFFVDKKDYVVVAPTKDLAAAFAKGAPGLDGKLSKAEAAKLLASDAGIYVDMTAVNKQYGDQIKAARKEAEEQLKKAGETIGKAQKAQMDMALKMIDPIFQAVEDSKTALFTVEVRPGGVSLHDEVAMTAGTKTAD